jgi:hypothetical protein
MQVVVKARRSDAQRSWRDEVASRIVENIMLRRIAWKVASGQALSLNSFCDFQSPYRRVRSIIG